MSYHVMPTAQLQKIADFLYSEYKGRDEVHELIKFIVDARAVNVLKEAEPTTPTTEAVTQQEVPPASGTITQLPE